MVAAEKQCELTSLRALEMRTREMSLGAQMAECITLLQSPEFVTDDLIESIGQIREAEKSADRVRVLCNQEESSEAFFYPARELFVQGDRSSFTCLATSVAFSDDQESGLIDYAAVTCEARPFPILGFTQTREGESAYPILLRSLSSLIELTRPNRFDAFDRDVYRGILGVAPSFDLVLVLWDEDVLDSRRPLCELTRDLSEVLKSTLAVEARFPPILNDIVCLRMNPKRFDGRLRFVWRV
jgi:hypothetical protein